MAQGQLNWPNWVTDPFNRSGGFCPLKTFFTEKKNFRFELATRGSPTSTPLLAIVQKTGQSLAGEGTEDKLNQGHIFQRPDLELNTPACNGGRPSLIARKGR